MIPALTFDVAQEFAEALAERLGNELVQIALFGSRARGDARWRSDYDLMVVLRSASGEVRDAVHRLATTFELEHNIDLSTKIVDQERFEQLRRSSLPFWRNYVRDERVLWPPTSGTIAVPTVFTITSDEALRIARLDAERVYHDLSPFRASVSLEQDGWHVNYELKDSQLQGGGPHYVIDPGNGAIVAKQYEQ